jgi:myo-inositol 2-dehydrogenase / D-chiro-inositol 1-dehydrogenase
VRVGLVGAGAMARRHVEWLRERSDVEVAVVCDIEAARAADLAALVGATVSTSWEATLAADELDALFVCTPPALHVGPAVASLERGLAVYLEKPLARSLEDGRRIVDAWGRSTAVCAVGYQWRSLDLLPALRAAIGDLTPGMLVSRSYGSTELGRGDRAVVGAGSSGSWFVDPRRSGGILFELGSHDIDLQCALAGPVVSVQASSASGRLALAGAPVTGLDDAVVVTLRFASGALGSVLIAWTDAQDPPLYSLDVLGTDVALHLELDPVFRLEGQARGTAIAETGRNDPRESTLDRFFEAVRSGDRGRVPCSPADALGTLATAIACEQSLASGAAAAVQA